MKRKRPPRSKQPKREKPRTATRLMLGTVMLFAITSSLLLAFQNGVFHIEALLLAVALPLLTGFSVVILAPRLSCDRLLVLLMCFLSSLGVILLFGLSPERGLRHLAMFALGMVTFVVAVLLSRVRRWPSWVSFLVVPVGLALLLAPLAIGQTTNGAKNWIPVPMLGSFQPSELVKLILLFVLAHTFSKAKGFGGMLPGLVFAVVCLGILMLEADLGTALLYYIVTLLLFWAASSNLPMTLVGLAGGVGAAYAGYTMFAHVKVRVAMWQNPWSDALGRGYQIVQALMAIGSGGLFGLGLGMGQSHVIPAYSTDFIFAVLCEQFGILFGLCVVCLYVILVLRGVAIALKARSGYPALLALGASLMLGMQTFVIIGGVIKLIPLTGVTLPFLSYGGTSMLSSTALVGILCGVSAQNARDDAADAALSEVTL